MSEELQKQREKIQSQSPNTKLEGDTSKLGMTRSLANDIKQGKLGDAQAKINDLRKQLEKKMGEGKLSKEEMAKLARELDQLSKMMGGKESDSALAKALAKAAEGLNAADMSKALAELKEMQGSLGDLKSAMEQLAALDAAEAALGSEWGDGKGAMGHIGGQWEQGAGDEGDGGMGRKGRGAGGKTGDLPMVPKSSNPPCFPVL